MGSIEISRKSFELRHSFSSDRRKQCEGAKASWRAGCSHTVLLKAQELLAGTLDLHTVSTNLEKEIQEGALTVL